MKKIKAKYKKWYQKTQNTSNINYKFVSASDANVELANVIMSNKVIYF